MSQAPQSQPVFVDIHIKNAHRVGYRTFCGFLTGQFEGDTQLAFEQYLGDFKFHGATYRTLRYEIVNKTMLLLHAVLNPLTTGPALAAPVMQPGPQYSNAQTQGSAYQMPYAPQPNQLVANFSGLVDPSTVQTMRYAPVNTARMSIPQPHQLNPHASEFQVRSTVNNLGASARPTPLPTAYSAPIYTPGLPVTQLSRSAPSNAHRGFLAPDHDWQRSRSNGEAATAAAAPSMSNRPNSAPARPPGLPVTQQPQSAPSNVRPGNYGPQPFPGSYDPYAASREAAELVAGPTGWMLSNTPIRLTHGPTVSQQPQRVPSNPHREGLIFNNRLGPSDSDYGDAAEATASPPALDHSYSTASRESLMATPSPLDLDAVSSLEITNPHWSPPQGSRHASEHSEDLSNYSSSVQDHAKSYWANPLQPSYLSSHPTANNSVPNANTTNITSHGPQNGGINIGRAPFPPAPAGQLQPRDGIGAILAYRVQQDWRPSTAKGDEKLPSDPLNKLSTSPFERFYTAYYKKWLKMAPPGSNIIDFAKVFDSLEDPTRVYSDEFDRLHLRSPDTTSSQRFQDTPTATISHRSGPSTVRNGINPSREVARSATPTLNGLADGGSRRNDTVLQTPPRPQLQNGNNNNNNNTSASNRNSHLYTRPTIDAWLEAQYPAGLQQEEEPWLMQRLNQHSLEFDAAYEDLLTMRKEAGVASK